MIHSVAGIVSFKVTGVSENDGVSHFAPTMNGNSITASFCG